jgi:hypothetical protein
MKTKNTGDARKVGARMWAIILAIVLLGALAIPAAVAQVPEEEPRPMEAAKRRRLT